MRYILIFIAYWKILFKISTFNILIVLNLTCGYSVCVFYPIILSIHLHKKAGKSAQTLAGYATEKMTEF
ncbi:hypothetical protein F990_01093 [Acinetobacter tjernbergiae DSM 14971 = CIP 107465]|uniref:Uncharacterized protein n=1 Tax=Acinetobacter tjernbergiae DSM 14971 = CIP 107465 TaxID=1120928 RepID=V2V261_9GAMM|nr:hypothetical protein F990_01093 [Acinetobacter tjernbergiae DSM 14971 = CIP 107465]